SVNTTGKRELWVRSLDSPSARRLSGVEDVWFPFFSPDGASIGFWMAGTYWRMDLAGGQPLAIIAGNERPRPFWTGDGRLVFSSADQGIVAVPITGGIPTPLSRGAGRNYTSPLILPRGGLLAFASGSGIYASSIDKPEEEHLIVATSQEGFYAPGEGGKGFLLRLQGTTLLAQQFDLSTFALTGEPVALADPVGTNGTTVRATVSENGVLLYDPYTDALQLTWRDRSGKPTGTIPCDGFSPRISPDGRRIAVLRTGQIARGIWTIETQRPVATHLTTGNSPVWSPDGRTVLFTNNAAILRRESSGASNDETVSECSSCV